jgi:hypothetical protein
LRISFSNGFQPIASNTNTVQNSKAMQPEELEKFKPDLKQVPLPLPAQTASTTIHCPSCGQQAQAEQININDKIAKCQQCHNVFSFQNEVSQLLKKENVKQEILRPEGIDVFRFKNELDISMEQPITVLEVLTMSILPIFVFLFTALFFKGKIGIVLPIISWLLALVFFSNLALHARHKVHLNISDRFLSIKWRPNKLHKDQFYPVQDIDQVYVKKEHEQFHVYLILNGDDGQKHVKLIGGLPNASKARFLEQEIEWHLGIEDREVPEEHA